MVEQLIRNERVNGSNPLSGSPLLQGVYLLNLTYLGILADATEGSFKTHKGAFGSRNYGYRSRYLFTLAGVNHAKVQYRGPALQM